MSTPTVAMLTVVTRSLDHKKSATLTVDLDAEAGVAPREGRDNKHRVQIRKTTDVPLAAVRAYLDGTMSFDTAVLQGISELLARRQHQPCFESAC
jgi:hypothetical protein